VRTPLFWVCMAVLAALVLARIYFMAHTG